MVYKRAESFRKGKHRHDVGAFGSARQCTAVVLQDGSYSASRSVETDLSDAEQLQHRPIFVSFYKFRKCIRFTQDKTYLVGLSIKHFS